MKTAISIPDKIFKEAERFAKRHQLNRSELYSAAIHEYVQRRSRASLTAEINEAADALNADFSAADNARSCAMLRSVEWR